MRLWSIHPKYMDTPGLNGLWKEALLAKRVLEGQTKGYKNHPQLNRFKAQDSPQDSIHEYLYWVHKESLNRGFKYNQDKFCRPDETPAKIQVTSGQVLYEFKWFMEKIEKRCPELHDKLCKNIAFLEHIELHPMFELVAGDIEDWEKIS